MGSLDFVVKAIKETINPEKIILFGSYSRGDQKNSSDFDLAVLKKTSKKHGEIAKVLTYLYRNGYDWNVSPDIHLFEEKNFNQRLKNNSLFIREIMKGKTIYEV